MSLGHASFRILQILRSPNLITDTNNIRSALGRMPWPKKVPDWLYRLAWTMRRADSDIHLLNLLHSLSRHVQLRKPWDLSKWQQWGMTALLVSFAGAPFTPFSHWLEEWLTELLPTHPYLAGLVMVGHFAVSVILVRFLFLNVLDTKRFMKQRKALQNFLPQNFFPK